MKLLRICFLLKALDFWVFCDKIVVYEFYRLGSVKMSNKLFQNVVQRMRRATERVLRRYLARYRRCGSVQRRRYVRVAELGVGVINRCRHPTFFHGRPYLSFYWFRSDVRQRMILVEWVDELARTSFEVLSVSLIR